MDLDILELIFDPKSIQYGISHHLLSVGGLLAILIFLGKQIKSYKKEVEDNKTVILTLKNEFEKAQAVSKIEISHLNSELVELKSALNRIQK